MAQRSWQAILVGLVLVLAPLGASAQDEMVVAVAPSATCGEASFVVEIEGGTSPFSLAWDFGDGEVATEVDVAALPYTSVHTYPAQGTYAWSLLVTDANSLEGSSAGSLAIEGPAVTLTSDPFPPLLTLGGDMTVAFEAQVSGGVAPYTYEWDLDGDGIADAGIDPSSNTASFTYGQADKVEASVKVTDVCGFTATAALPVVGVDPETICHPMAQRIADAVNSLFPEQAETLYTCEDIYNIFLGGVADSNIGFGRLWHAYKLSQVIEGLTWEEILDWHLNGNGWGLLTQLDRFTEAVEGLDIADLVGRVLSGEVSVSDVRTAVRAVVRYGADFDGAIERVLAGDSAGEVNQFYKTAGELEIDPMVLDEYLAMGFTLPELRHASAVAERTGADWAEVLNAHGAGDSWGKIMKSLRETEAGEPAGAEADQEQEQDQDRKRKHEREQEETAIQLRVAERLANQFGVSYEDVVGVYEGTCDHDWGCVRAFFKGEVEQGRDNKGKGKGSH